MRYTLMKWNTQTKSYILYRFSKVSFNPLYSFTTKRANQLYPLGYSAFALGINSQFSAVALVTLKFLRLRAAVAKSGEAVTGRRNPVLRHTPTNCVKCCGAAKRSSALIINVCRLCQSQSAAGIN